MVYKACILSRIDYEAQAYGCASPHLLHQLNIIQNNALRIIAKVPDNVSGKSLEVEFNIMPLQYRCKLQDLKYYLKIHSLKMNHPIQRASILTLQRQYNLFCSNFPRSREITASHQIFVKISLPVVYNNGGFSI